mgnify:CR=1 FL=1|jgi:hypothetical protein
MSIDISEKAKKFKYLHITRVMLNLHKNRERLMPKIQPIFYR